MTAPTVEQLRTPQPENPDFTINRDRLRVLNCVDQHRVRRTANGKDAVMPANGNAGFGSRIRVCDLWAAGLVVLAEDNHYQLTDIGRHRRRQTIDEYDTQRISERSTCLGADMDCGRPLPCPDHPARLASGETT